MVQQYKTEGKTLTFKAGEDFVAPHRVVQLSSTEGSVDFQAASSSVDTPVIGVITHSASSGEAVSVQMDGVALVEAYAAIGLGARVHNASIDGKIDDSEDGTAGAMYIGLALEAATAKGQIISVLLNCPAIAGNAS